MTITSERRGDSRRPPPRAGRAAGLRPGAPCGPTFPILRREINGHPLVYLDSASSSQKPDVVIDALSDYYREYNANVHRGIYTIGEEATAAYEAGPDARSPGSSTRPIATRSSSPGTRPRRSTSSSYSWGRRNIGEGDTIVLTEMEHHANLVPWQLLVQEKDGDLEFIPITDDGILRLDVFEVLLRLKPKLVAFTHVSNTLGTINPVREMVDMAHAAGALVLVDGAQAVPHLPVDVQALGCDFYAFSGHKMLGPMGSGALWARRELLEAMPPFLSGGEMIREVHLRRSDFNDIPWKFEAGTPAVGDAIGLGVAADYLEAIGMDAVRDHERVLVAYALDALAARGARDRAVRANGSRAARRGDPVQPAGHPPPRRRPGPRPLRASRSGPATTARCRSTSGSTWRPRPGPASASTRRPRTSTPWSPACSRSSASSGHRAWYGAGLGPRPPGSGRIGFVVRDRQVGCPAIVA